MKATTNILVNFSFCFNASSSASAARCATRHVTQSFNTGSSSLRIILHRREKKAKQTTKQERKTPKATRRDRQKRRLRRKSFNRRDDLFNLLMKWTQKDKNKKQKKRREPTTIVYIVSSSLALSQTPNALSFSTSSDVNHQIFIKEIDTRCMRSAYPVVKNARKTITALLFICFCSVFAFAGRIELDIIISHWQSGG